MIPTSLLRVIRRFEGLRLRVYRCPAGIPTQGYGHTGKEVQFGGPPITVQQAEEWLLRDAEYFTAVALRHSPILAHDQNKLAAIADFCFNLGAARYKASTLKRRINAGDWVGAEVELRKWVWGGGKKLPGLVLRREVEALLLRGDTSLLEKKLLK